MGVGGAVRGVVRGVFRDPLKLKTQNSNFLNPEPQAAKRWEALAHPLVAHSAKGQNTEVGLTRDHFRNQVT